jgi:ribosome-associated translation inhibitor RaiA
MQSKTRIHWHGLDRSDAVESLIHERVADVNRFESTLIGAHVTIELPHRHKAHGKQFHVKVQLDYPNHEIVVSHDPTSDKTHKSHDDLGVAIRDVFTTAKRQVKQWSTRRRDLARQPPPTS